MTRASDFPNLSSPLWDRVRVPARGTIENIAAQLCAEAGIDADLVRNVCIDRRTAPAGVVRLRGRIVYRLRQAGFTITEMEFRWFVGFKRSTLQDYLVEGRREEENVDA